MNILIRRFQNSELFCNADEAYCEFPYRLAFQNIVKSLYINGLLRKIDKSSELVLCKILQRFADNFSSREQVQILFFFVKPRGV